MISKFEVLKKYADGVFTTEEAAKLLNVSEKVVKMQLTIWRPKIDKLIPVLKALEMQPEVKKEQAKLKSRLAKALGTTVRNANRQLKVAGISVPRPKKTEKREELKENAQERWELHKKHAFDVIAGLDTPENACIGAELSSRQMYRAVNNLLALVGLSMRDLSNETLTQRKKVLAQVEEALKEQGNGTTR